MCEPDDAALFLAEQGGTRTTVNNRARKSGAFDALRWNRWVGCPLR
ncbi:hypothetical protein M2161_008949 [Streptomyces sp. SAI-133]|nr:hypothetical protein [Streptomyces sp. SAI-133]